jgi:hypothetical protein
VINWYLNPSPGIRSTGLTVVIMALSPTDSHSESNRIP